MSDNWSDWLTSIRCAGDSAARPAALTASDVQRLEAGLSSSSYSYVSGGTHSFYHYPARFSPAVASAVIQTFSEPGDWVLDPFMGGGTAIIEGLRLGRKVIGVDVNTLAHFVARVRTTALSSGDEESVRRWARRSAELVGGGRIDHIGRPDLRNLPGGVKVFLGGALSLGQRLASPRRRDFARCVLLRLGQWALDCREFVAPSRQRLAEQLPTLADEMLAGLHEFVDRCGEAGTTKSEIRRNRRLLCRSAVDLEQDARVRSLGIQPRLVFTSPPYPGVHVLYHRWQYRGRRETAAPYWIACLRDGHFESFYTGGSRTPTGQRRYFEMIRAAFRSIRALVDPEGLVVQLVGFADADAQLPLYLEAMEAAGFDEYQAGEGVGRLGRRVPNRKWYAELKGDLDASSELLLFHRPA